MIKYLFFLFAILAGPAAGADMIASFQLTGVDTVAGRRGHAPEVVVAAAIAWEAKGAKMTFIVESDSQGSFGRHHDQPGEEAYDPDLTVAERHKQAMDQFIEERKQVPYKTNPYATVTNGFIEGNEKDLRAMELDPLIEYVKVIGPAPPPPEMPRVDPGPFPLTKQLRRAE